MSGVRKKPLANGKYQAWYTDCDGTRRFIVGTEDRIETRDAARELEGKHRLIRIGAVPRPKASCKPRLLSEVAKEYLEWGKSQGGHGGRPWSTWHYQHRLAHMEFWQAELSIRLLHEISLRDVEAVLRDLQAKGRVPKNRKKAVKMSGKSLNNYGESLKSVCEWAKERDYLEENPLRSLKGFDSTPLVERRSVAPEQIQLILDNATRPQDRLLFEVVLCTGYRRGELRALRVKDLDVEARTLSLPAAFCKNRKNACQPIPQALALKLAESVKGKPEGERLLVVNDKTR